MTRGLRLKARWRVWKRIRAMKKKPKRKKTGFGWRSFIYGLAATAFVIFLQAMDFGGLKAVNEAAFDQYQRWKPRTKDPASPVRVVDIDVQSLQELGQWPWPRTELAELVRRLTELGAISVSFDVVFAEPDRTSPKSIVESWRKYDPDANVVLGNETLADHDAIFADMIAQAPVVLGVVLDNAETGEVPQTAKKSGYGYITHQDTSPSTLIKLTPEFYSANVNLPEFAEAASGIGNFALSELRGEIIRRVPLLARIKDNLIPTLALEGIRVGFQTGSIRIKSDDAGEPSSYQSSALIESMTVGPMEVPVEYDGGLYVYYSGQTSNRPDRTISVADIMRGDQVDQALAEKLGGAIVFVGTSAPGLLDLVATPFEPQTAGVNVHAELADQIIARYFQQDRIAYRQEILDALPQVSEADRPQYEEVVAQLDVDIAANSEPIFITRPVMAEGAERIFILLIGVLICVILGYNRLALAAVAAGLGFVSVAAACWFSFDLYGFLLGPVYPALGVLLPWGTLTIYNYARTDRDKKAVKSQFEHFVSPEVVADIAEDPESLLTPGGDLRDLSIMFCDVRKFSTITENMTPQETILFINEFLTPLTEVVLRNSGTIDKYMGDCIMAFWNAPRKSDLHMEQATLALFQFKQALEEINESFVSLGFPAIDIGVGVNTGPCAVGAMGSKKRLDYSCIGDAVNLSSRLEGITKQYCLWNCIGNNTAEGVAHAFALLEIDSVAVKGRTQPETIWTVVGEADMLNDPTYLELRRLVDEGIRAYKAQEWDAAEAAYRAAGALKMDALDPEGLAGVFIDRINEFRASPPPADWDGVYVATSK